LWLVSLVPLVSPEPRVLRAPLVPLVRALRALLDPRDPLAPPALLDTPSLENPALLVDPENPESPEPLVIKEIPEPPAPRDLGACLDLLEARDPLACLPPASPDLPVCLELWDQEESPVTRDTPESLVCPVRKVTEESDRLDLRVRQDPWDLRDQLEQQVHQV